MEKIKSLLNCLKREYLVESKKKKNSNSNEDSHSRREAYKKTGRRYHSRLTLQEDDITKTTLQNDGKKALL